MILHDFKCPNGHVFEKMVEWNVESVLCPECQWKVVFAERVFLPRPERPENANRFNPVVVFRKPNGEYRFPGRADERTPRGCVRVELKDIQAVRRFEREENQRLKTVHEASMARRGANYEAEKKERREILKSVLSKMSPRARKFAEFAMQQSDQRESFSHRAAQYDANFRIDAFSNDASNRSDFIDKDTGWRKKRE
jgi:hypothetical protein